MQRRFSAWAYAMLCELVSLNSFSHLGLNAASRFKLREARGWNLIKMYKKSRRQFSQVCDCATELHWVVYCAGALCWRNKHLRRAHAGKSTHFVEPFILLPMLRSVVFCILRFCS